ncbi:Hypothetical predicted protein [Paramuricea clavata]|uniref:Uncharacterized protein n=1 Tax=Paramuricea clavata TaxID=317549 RepID=A0A6S7GLB6_PARCT|nr:Hypothetical predicted protein [Paramuricea clavata]
MATGGANRTRNPGSPSSTPNSKRSPQLSLKESSPCRPSERLNPKTIDPFKNNVGKQSTFAAVYSNGGVPCRLQHGSVKHKIQWDVPIENLSFDPLLVTLAEGLRETKHPYHFLACQGFREMLEVSDAAGKTIPVLPKLVLPLRLALISRKMMEKNNKEKITHALQEIESNCGQACLAIIKSKVPTYQSVLK